MITSKIAADTSYAELIQLTKTHNASSKAAGSNLKDSVPDTKHTEFVKIDKSLFELLSSQSVYSKMNLIANSVRVADRAMHKINAQIDQMKARLQEYVKHYPPFGKGKKEQVRLLKQYSAFRRQIDQLTIPADNYGAMKIMADPSLTADAGDWEVDLDKNGATPLTIHSQQVHTGPKGLNIPELPAEVTVKDLHGAIANLASAKEILSQRQDKLKSNFQNILDQTRMWR